MVVPLFAACGSGEKTAQAPGVLAEKMPVAQILTNFRTDSRFRYEWAPLLSGGQMYTDRGYFYIGVPPDLSGFPALKPANDDKYSSAEQVDFITFTLTRKARVYIIYTNLNTRLEARWLTGVNGWQREKLLIETTLTENKSTRLVRSREFPAGAKVALGGNGCEIYDCDMFTVVIEPVP